MISCCFKTLTMIRTTAFFSPLFLLLAILPFSVRAQTNVSGPISVNTIWTTTGSPYIVLDTVMLSPGVKLTIQPGVTVKFATGAWLTTNSQFNNAASIIAAGTNIDSITFTSNSSNPIPGSWVGISLNGGDDSSSIFSYCNFRYAATAVFDNQGVLDLLTINDCSFDNNLTGLKDNGRLMHVYYCDFRNNNCGLLNIANSRIYSCHIAGNQTGFDCNNPSIGSGNSFVSCKIDSNQTGVRGLAGYCSITGSKIRYNQYGIIFNYSNSIMLQGSQVDSNTIAGISIHAGGITIDSCLIRFNSIGITDSGGTSQNSITRNRIENNSVGINLGTANEDIHCNKICNNILYDLRSFTSANISVSGNDWCTPDSASTQAVLFDGNDSAGLGFVSFMPIDTNQCSNCSPIFINYTTTLAGFAQQNGTATAYPSNGHPPYSYSWSTIPVQTTQTATGLGAGNYTVCVTDSLGCSDCIGIAITDSNSVYVNEVLSGFSFSFFPNPASDHISLVFLPNHPKATITILNLMGETEYVSATAEDKTDIDISALTCGVHIIQIVTGDKISWQKLIKE